MDKTVWAWNNFYDNKIRTKYSKQTNSIIEPMVSWSKPERQICSSKPNILKLRRAQHLNIKMQLRLRQNWIKIYFRNLGDSFFCLIVYLVNCLIVFLAICFYLYTVFHHLTQKSIPFILDSIFIKSNQLAVKLLIVLFCILLYFEELLINYWLLQMYSAWLSFDCLRQLH